MLKVKIAKTSEELEKGLMFTYYLPEDEGMLFSFDSPRRLTFWGKNTFIPLDIAFIDEHNKIKKIDKIETMDLKTVSCDNCVIAVEANRGFFKNNQIEVGDILELKKDKFFNTIIDNYYTCDFYKKDIKVAQFSDERILPDVNVGDLDDILEDSFDFENEEIDEAIEPEKEQQIIQEYPVFETFYEAYKWAKENNETMKIDYTTKRGRHVVRLVEPHGDFHSRSTKKQIMVCWDETMNNIRAFIISQVSQWAFIGQKFNKKFNVNRS
jgi:uncharacterized membrane protein (UPF0127 family)